MDTMGVMVLGIAAGRFFPERYKRQNQWVQLASTLLLIFLMGVGLGRREGFFQELARLGALSFLFCIVPVCFSIAAVYLLSRRFLEEKPGEGREGVGPAGAEELPGQAEDRPAGAAPEGPARDSEAPVRKPEPSSPRSRRLDPMMFLALGALILGIGGGAVPAAAQVLAPLADRSQWVLYLLMASVGISVGLQKGVWRQLRRYHVKALVIPLGIVLGSVAGGVFCGWLTGFPVRQAVSVAGGMGWYSLAGVSVGNLAGASLGSVAFLGNLMRETLSFFLIPGIARRLNGYTCIAPAGATSEDTTLPMIMRYTNEETAVLSVFNGMVCSLAVPVIIACCY